MFEVEHFNNHSSIKKKGSSKRYSIQCNDTRFRRIDRKNHQTLACVKLLTLSTPDLIQFLTKFNEEAILYISLTTLLIL